MRQFFIYLILYSSRLYKSMQYDLVQIKNRFFFLFCFLIWYFQLCCYLFSEHFGWMRVCFCYAFAIFLWTCAFVFPLIHQHAVYMVYLSVFVACFNNNRFVCSSEIQNIRSWRIIYNTKKKTNWFCTVVQLDSKNTRNEQKQSVFFSFLYERNDEHVVVPFFTCVHTYKLISRTETNKLDNNSNNNNDIFCRRSRFFVIESIYIWVLKHSEIYHHMDVKNTCTILNPKRNSKQKQKAKIKTRCFCVCFESTRNVYANHFFLFISHLVFVVVSFSFWLTCC